MIDDKLFQELKFGQTVYCITGPGQFAKDEMCSIQGPIIEKSETQFGLHVTIRIEKCYDKDAIGKTTMITTLDRIGERKGIGSYF